MTTLYHAKYFAHELTRNHGSSDSDRLSMALFDACVDLTPHQIEAALFALRSPLSKGVILADEVGLGKTIEAGLVLCQQWAERKRKLLVICPASLRKQWSLELRDKFNLPNTVLEARSYKEAVRAGNPNPFMTNRVVITSFQFASRMRGDIRAVPFDLVVIDEAHKMRNAYQPSNKMGQSIRWALEDRKKVLLTATPLQNSLIELFGLSTIIDDMIFGDVDSFRSQYASAGADLKSLRERLAPFCKRTLRRQVVEYVRYTERLPHTIKFHPNDDEQKLYEAVSEFLMREDTFALPKGKRHLTAIILRKLLASSSRAVAGTLETMRDRLIAVRDRRIAPEEIDSPEWVEDLIETEEMEGDLVEEVLSEIEEAPEAEIKPEIAKIGAEIEDLTRYAQWARSIGIDTKSRSLLQALKTGFEKLQEMGANRRALIFTESRRTQDYLKDFLESNGYAGQVVLFNGSNTDPESRQITQKWIEANQKSGRVTGAKTVDARTALIEHFRDSAPIMLATEAAAEGVNLQFCSLVINYDLPWNPQRIEQRIGRCHRYGQKHDVVVINFLNERNEADRRVHELLSEKFNLFSGVFGASDQVLGTIESGVDFERRILAIYQQCRTPAQIDQAFRELQNEMEESIKTRMDDTRKVLLEQFDEDVHAKLKVRLDDTRANLDRISAMFWTLTKMMLGSRAKFYDDSNAFELKEPPESRFKQGRYHLIDKRQMNDPGEFLYRLSHPLGEWSLEHAKRAATPPAHVRFDLTKYPKRIAMVEAVKGKSGWLTLQKVVIESFEEEERLLFSAFTDQGESVDIETCEKFFQCEASISPLAQVPPQMAERIEVERQRHLDSAIAQSTENNNRFFIEERDRLEKWADDMVIAAERDLRDTKEQIKSLKRAARLATTLSEQAQLQEKLQEAEKRQRRQRQEIFNVEDQIAEKRDKLIEGIQRRMRQKTSSESLFTIRWEIV